ncbi:hypothetical protein AB0D12_37745 [Streptomyces sp. NPDC048479]|uniref:hypothetical protein n=1 Tax=Streptomyces sp. NPDC048479 TaxID=3154725 RepID=UPI003431DF3B
MAEWVDSRRGWMLIDFPVDSGLAFVSAMATAGPRDAFYVRMTHWAAPDAWDVTVKPMDVAMFQEELVSRFRLQLLQVSFPAYDLPELTRRLREHAAGRSVPPAPADWSSVGRYSPWGLVDQAGSRRKAAQLATRRHTCERAPRMPRMPRKPRRPSLGQSDMAEHAPGAAWQFRGVRGERFIWRDAAAVLLDAALNDDRQRLGGPAGR